MSNLNGVEEYQTAATGGWTRIEMLLEIYQHAIDQMTAADLALKSDDKSRSRFHLLKSQNAVFAIFSGLNTEDEIGMNVARLCHFVFSCIESRNLKDGITILKTLKDGFEQIRLEANKLEAEGEIPELDNVQEIQASF